MRASVKLRLSIAFICAAAVVSAAGFLSVSNAQRRDAFSHATAAHKKLNCASCHKNPTTNWVSARGYPDVADFPGHASCINCHRADFFAGNRPAICAGCHTNPGPRGAARFPFPVRTRSQEFRTIFPHDVHQNLIAGNNRKRGDIAVAHIVKAAFIPAPDDPPQFNNCAICHETTKTLPKFGPRDVSLQPLANAAPESFVPTADFFKNSPDSHASCFNCHYQNQKPARTDCAGCHELTTAHRNEVVIKRYSLKFDHQSPNHVNKDCITCHVRIAQNADLRSLKDADVPILTCSTSSCHGPKINEEIGKREASLAANQPAFQCTYCHAADIGRFPVPPSHQIR